MAAATATAESSIKEKDSKIKDMQLDLQDSEAQIQFLKQQVPGDVSVVYS